MAETDWYLAEVTLSSSWNWPPSPEALADLRERAQRELFSKDKLVAEVWGGDPGLVHMRIAVQDTSAEGAGHRHGPRW